jgi:hypothetical protein
LLYRDALFDFQGLCLPVLEGALVVQDRILVVLDTYTDYKVACTGLKDADTVNKVMFTVFQVACTADKVTFTVFRDRYMGDKVAFTIDLDTCTADKDWCTADLSMYLLMSWCFFPIWECCFGR